MGVNGDDDRLRQLEAELRVHYFASCPAGYLETDWGKNDLANHLRKRLEMDRTIIVPWLDGVRRLDGLEVLEIGCGTGSSTVALAERGARVTGVDVDEGSLAVARRRCELHGVEASFVRANAADLPPSLRGRTFDVVVFYASLEHMTLAERLAAARDTWEMLRAGGLWSVIETPNRLWYFDWHTSLLPFFLWLPDDLAFRYSRFSERPNFGELYREETPEQMLHFLRRGRGVSFHELELALGPLQTLELAGWIDWRGHRRESVVRRLRRMLSAEGQFARALRRIAPRIPEAFLQPRLDFAIRKREVGA